MYSFALLDALITLVFFSISLGFIQGRGRLLILCHTNW